MKNTKTAQQVLDSLTFSEVDARLQPDTRDMMRRERFSLRAAMDSGDVAKIAEAKEEAVRVATMWGVSL